MHLIQFQLLKGLLCLCLVLWLCCAREAKSRTPLVFLAPGASSHLVSQLGSAIFMLVKMNSRKHIVLMILLFHRLALDCTY